MMTMKKRMIKILLLLVVVSCNTEIPPHIPLPSYPFENPEQITIDSLKKDTAWLFSTKKYYFPEIKDSVTRIHAYRGDSYDNWYFTMYGGDTLIKHYFCAEYWYCWKNPKYSKYFKK